MRRPLKRSLKEKITSRDKVRTHRERLRAQGLRPIQIWVPDVRTAGFTKEARRQSKLAARSAHATKDQAFVDMISEMTF